MKKDKTRKDTTSVNDIEKLAKVVSIGVTDAIDRYRKSEIEMLKTQAELLRSIATM